MPAPRTRCRALHRSARSAPLCAFTQLRPLHPSARSAHLCCAIVLTLYLCLLARSRYGDGWNGNVLMFVDDANAEEVHAITQGSPNPNAHEAEDHEVCFPCGACITGTTGGGTYIEETSWSLTDESGDVVAEAAEDAPATFCTDTCVELSTSCEAGKQPNANDDGCEFCPAGFWSNTNSAEPCEKCEAGTYMAMTGATACDSCEAGTAAADKAATACVQCEAGK